MQKIMYLHSAWHSIILILAMMIVMVIVVMVFKLKYLIGNNINYWLVWKYRFSREENITPTV